MVDDDNVYLLRGLLDGRLEHPHPVGQSAAHEVVHHAGPCLGGFRHCIARVKVDITLPE